MAIVSDTHGYIDPGIVHLVAGCDAAIHAGDIGSASVLEALRPKAELIFAVAGNNDIAPRWDRSEKAVVNTLSDQHTIVLPGGTISVEHGHAVYDDNMNRFHQALRKRHRASRAVVYGHTHVRLFDRSEKPWLLNPGAAGLVRNYGGPSCLVLEVRDKDWTVTEHVFSGQVESATAAAT